MGRGGKEFNMLKFRTMYEGEKNGNGSKITAQDDPRITVFGKWLRDTKVNELPQLWNVLIGDMSLVGPRPEDPDIVKTWPEDYQQLLLSVRPGVTSPATIIYRDEESLLSTADVMQDYLIEILPTKMRLEKLYVRNRSVTTDLDVIFWTAVALLPKMRQLNVPQYYLYWGPISRIFGRYLSWFTIDALITFIAVTITGLIWRLSGPLDIGVGKAILYALGISLLFSLMNLALGLNKVEWSRAPANNVFTLGISITLATLVVLVLDVQNLFSAPLPVPVIIISAVLSFFGFIGMRYRERLITGTASRWLKFRGGVNIVGERVLIVGAGENSGLAAWIFGRSALGKASSVIGIVDDDPRKQGLRYDGYEVLGTTSAIPELVKKHDIGLIFYTIDNIVQAQRARILSLCHLTGVKLVVLPDILEILRKELIVVHTPENVVHAICPEKDAEILLDEIQSLLVDSAQERLTAFRQQYLPKNR
jgi:lipopolysaccharide/colanic/teichoic acid biosynthesis glycosyltransferase